MFSPVQRVLLGVMASFFCLACSAQELARPLVLSGDEQLSAGPLLLDERDIQAVFVDDSLRVTLSVQSHLPLSLGGEAAISLRDLGEQVVAAGAAKLWVEDQRLWVQADLQPAPRQQGAQDLASYVLHGSLRVAGMEIRFRRSLFQAFAATAYRLATPAKALPGQAFPVVASFGQNPGSHNLTLLASDAATTSSTQQLEMRPLGDQADNAAGLFATQYALPAELSTNQTLQLRLQHRVEPEPSDPNAGATAFDGVQTLPCAQVENRAVLELWPSAPVVRPGQALHVIARQRQRVGSVITESQGQACWLREGKALFCQSIDSDGAGLTEINWTVPAGFSTQQSSQLRLRFAQAEAVVPVALSETSAPLEGVSIVVTSAQADKHQLHLEARVVGGQGLRYHLQLHAQDLDGPLLVERQGWLDNEHLQASLTIPEALALNPTSWALLLGVEDSLGRRLAQRQYLLASDEGLVLGLVVARDWPWDQDFALLLTSQDSTGQPCSASGTVQIGDHNQDVSIDASGMLLLQMPASEQAEQGLHVELSDDEGRAAQLVRTLHFSPPATRVWPWTTPARLDAQARLSVQAVENSNFQALGLWASHAQVLVASHLGPAQSGTLLTLGQAPMFGLQRFAVDVHGDLQRDSQVILGEDPGQLELADDATRPRLIIVRDHQPSTPSTLLRYSGDQALRQPGQLSLQQYHQLLNSVGDQPDAVAVVRASLVTQWSDGAEAPTELHTDDDIAQAQARAQLQVAIDLDAIFSELSQRIADTTLSSADIQDWVQRRAHAYFDPWGQSYNLRIEAGQLRLESLGLDELRDTGDELAAARFVHGLIMDPAESGENSSPGEVDAVDWRQSLPTPNVVRLNGDAVLSQMPSAQSSQYLALFDDGRSTSTENLALPIKSIHAPSALWLRRGDRLDLPIAVYAPEQTEVQLDWTQAADSAFNLTPTEATLHSRDGWFNGLSQLRVGRDEPQTLTLKIRSGGQEIVHPVALHLFDDDADMAALGAKTSWVDKTSTVTLPTAGLRQPTLVHAQVFATGRALAEDLARTILGQLQRRQPRSVAEISLALELINHLEPAQRPSPQPWLMALGFAQNSDGGFAPLHKPSLSLIETSLDALRGLSVAKTLARPQDQLSARLVDFLQQQMQDDGGLAADGVSADSHSLRRQRLRNTARWLEAVTVLSPDHPQILLARDFVWQQSAQLTDSLSLAMALRALQQSGASHAQVQTVRQRLLALQEHDEENNPQAFVALTDDTQSEEEARWLSNAVALQALLSSRDDDENDAPQNLIPVLNQLLQSCAVADITASPRDQIEILAAFAAWPYGAGQVRLLHDDGEAWLDAESPELQWSTRSDQAIDVSLQAQAPAALLIRLWSEGPPALPLHNGPNLELEAPAVISLGLHQARRFALSVRPNGAGQLADDAEDPELWRELYLWSQAATCVDLGVQIAEQIYFANPGQGVNLRIDGAAQNQGLWLWLTPRCRGTFAMPLLRVEDPQRPGLISTSAPINVVVP